MPKISVVMSVYNGEYFLREAIDSILAQSFTDFEFIIIDDCSTDSSVDVINSYQDKRIRLLRNEKNLRLPASLNKGIMASKGEYIARMDADDISLPNRFEKQVEYLDRHTDIVALGGSYQAIDKDGNNLYIHRAMKGDRLEKYFLYPSPISHPTVMIRREIMMKHNLFYDEQYPSAQDYELWQRIHQKFRIDNLSDILLKYRVQSNSISVTKKKQQRDNMYKIFRTYAQVPVSYYECMAITHKEYIIRPWHQAVIMHNVFKTWDYFYWRNVIGYAIRYIMSKLKR